MFVVEGSPGAGKTTALGALLTRHPDMLIFPEAQPTPGTVHPGDMHALLAEDAERTEYAQRASATGALVASDRCHLGVLAYRYALTATGLQPQHVFDEALDHVRQLDLNARHHDDEIRVTVVDPDWSRARRSRHAADPRYRSWFDVAFLTAYNEFLLHLDRWVRPGPRWSTTVATGADQGSPTTHVAPPDAGVSLLCERGCTDPRSPVVESGRGRLQLFTGAVHQQGAAGDVRCLRSAGDVTTAWRGHTPAP